GPRHGSSRALPARIALQINIILAMSSSQLGPLVRISEAYLVGGSLTLIPVAAERRAASRISVTVTLVSSEESGSDLAPSRTTARTYESELSYGAGTGLAAISSSWVLLPPRRTRMSSLFTVIT